MLRRKLVWALILGSAAAAAQTVAPAQPAASVCPWLTAGNAGWALGGDVDVKVAVTGADEGSCVFSRSTDSLEVVVSAKPTASCPAGSASLKGIGNEAAVCDPPAARGTAVEMISSHVRNIYFEVTLSSHGKKSAKLDDALEQIAEQVAGNLY